MGAGGDRRSRRRTSIVLMGTWAPERNMAGRGSLGYGHSVSLKTSHDGLSRSGYDRDLERVVVDGGRMRIPVFEFETHLERTGFVDLKTECAGDGWRECPSATYILPILSSSLAG
jgi:hypothetical protein